MNFYRSFFVVTLIIASSASAWATQEPVGSTAENPIVLDRESVELGALSFEVSNSLYFARTRSTPKNVAITFGFVGPIEICSTRDYYGPGSSEYHCLRYSTGLSPQRAKWQLKFKKVNRLSGDQIEIFKANAQYPVYPEFESIDAVYPYEVRMKDGGGIIPTFYYEFRSKR
jgi:hypothetical protein